MCRSSRGRIYTRLVLFKTFTHEPIRRGDITLTVRRWRTPQAKVGGQYRLHSGGAIEVTALDIVEPDDLTEHDAHLAGFKSLKALLRSFAKHEGGSLYRIAFTYIGELPDPRAELAASDELSVGDIADLRARLDRMDGDHPWTRDVLWLIEDNEGVRAGDLAPAVGMETQRFKTNVRRLKSLGLTQSLETGYRVSPRGFAFLEAEGSPA